MLRVHLLGYARVLLDDAPLPTAGRPKTLPLFAYLLLNRRAELQRETVAAALWPEADLGEGRANLRRHLHYIDAMLAPACTTEPWLLRTATTLRCNPALPLWLDVAEFERLSADPQTATEAAALYEGDLLPNADEPWLLYERERLRGAYAGCLTTIAAAQRARRNYAEAIGTIQKILALDPFREDAVRTLMTVRYESGDGAGAVREYERFAASLREEMGVAPMTETTAAYRAIVEGTPATGPAASPEPPPAQESAPGELPLLERETELHFLRDLWLRAAAGNAAFVSVGGDAGIGKTRLAREFGALCESRGGQVFAGAMTWPVTTPYQALAGVLRSMLPLAMALKLDRTWLNALEPLLYNAPAGIAPTGLLETERARLFEACAVVIETVCRRRPACIVLDDLQWAGQPMVELLERLTRRLRTSPVLFVATYREEELDAAHPFRALRQAIEGDGRGSNLALRPLGMPALETFIAARAEGDERRIRALIDYLHQSSEGNPFLITESVRNLVESGALKIDGERWSLAGRPEIGLPGDEGATIPARIEAGVRARLERLEPPARSLIETAAVAGRSFDISVLTQATGWREGAVLDAVGDLLARRLIAEAGGAGTQGDFTFAHHLVQASVYATIAPERLPRRHRRLAQVIEDLFPNDEARAAELALHWERGGEPRRAARYYIVSARQALAVYALDDAQRRIDHALALDDDERIAFDALLTAEDIARLRGERVLQGDVLDRLDMLGRELAEPDARFTLAVRRIDLAHAIADRANEERLIEGLAREAYAAGYARGRSEALAARARFLRTTGDFDGALAAYDRLIASDGGALDGGVHFKAALARADVLIYRGRLEEAVAALEDVRHAANTDRHALVRTLMALARAALSQQDYGAMTHHAREAYALSREIGDREGEALALHTLANGQVYTFQVAEARARYLAAIALYDAIDHGIGQASIAVDFGLFHTEIGLLRRGVELFARADAIAEKIGFRWVSCVSALNTAYARRLLGDFDAAMAAGRHALEIARSLSSTQLESAALGALAAAERERGDLDQALAHARHAVELRRPAGPTPRLGDNLSALSSTLLARGEIAAALEAAGELLALYEYDPKLAPQPTEWLLTAASVFGASGDGARRIELLRQAESVMGARAAAIDDDATREAFLALPFNRAVADALAELTVSPRTRG